MGRRLLLLAAGLASALWAWPAAAQSDAGAPDASASDAGTPCVDPSVLTAAAEADARLREKNDCNAEDLAKLAAAVTMFDACLGEEKPKPAARWIFPVANVTPASAIGGSDGSGFVKNPNIHCYVTSWAGHPAHDLFVDDPHQTSRDAKGAPFPALAVESAYVLVSRDGWKQTDQTRGGNYAMLYLPARHQIAYYAHLETLEVKAGERLEAGALVGTIGRTGKNASPARSQTHLHFGLWDAATFRPVNSYPLLRAAKMLPATAP
jgi:murein DD-endopeptidase MepM/ murein hydrolase activator NlpD